jgi:hypothetical protein
MEIHHRFEFVSGHFETDTGELIAVKNPKYGEVHLCFKDTWNIPFARIRLHSKDLFIDAKAVLDDAYNLAQEIAHRWNTHPNAPLTFATHKDGATYQTAIRAEWDHRETQPAAAMMAWTKVWQLDGDLVRCRHCTRAIHIDRRDEAFVHASDCPQAHLTAPWQDLRSRIP